VFIAEDAFLLAVYLQSNIDKGSEMARTPAQSLRQVKTDPSPAVHPIHHLCVATSPPELASGHLEHCHSHSHHPFYPHPFLCRFAIVQSIATKSPHVCLSSCP